MRVTGVVQMSYKDEFPERVEIEEKDLDDVSRIVLQGLIREGEFQTRDAFIEILEKEVDSDFEPTNHYSRGWVDGINYCIHLLKNLNINTKK
jgi:hypothetical protein